MWSIGKVVITSAPSAGGHVFKSGPLPIFIVLHKLFVCFLHYNIVIDLIKNLVSAALSMLFNTIVPVRYRLCYVSKRLYRTSLYQILMCSVQHNFTELTVFVPPGYNYCIKYQRNLYRTHLYQST